MVDKVSDHPAEEHKPPAETWTGPASHPDSDDHKTTAAGMDPSLSLIDLPRNIDSHKVPIMDPMHSLAFLTDPLAVFTNPQANPYEELMRFVPGGQQSSAPMPPPVPKMEAPPQPHGPERAMVKLPPPITIGGSLAARLCGREPAPLPASVARNSAVPKQMNGKTHMDPRLENIVSTVDLDCKLDLRKIALQAKNAEYNPKRFAAVIMRIRNPKTTALIFSSGKMVCTGAKTVVDSETAARKYAKTIKKLGFDVRFKKFTIQNIVGSCAVDFRISLEHLKLKYDKFCTYDPEIFPGLIFRMGDPKIVLLIFCSGKVVLTGAKEKQQLIRAFDKIFPMLCLFQIPPGGISAMKF